MGGEIQVTQKSSDWETSGLHPGLRWQFSVNTNVTDSNGLSCGYLQIAAGAELPLHFHKEQEIYIITKGNAECRPNAGPNGIWLCHVSTERGQRITPSTSGWKPVATKCTCDYEGWLVLQGHTQSFARLSR